MKRILTLKTVVTATLMALTLGACESDETWNHGYFNLSTVLDAYFSEYGAFGTDEGTTTGWFDRNYPYADNRDYNDFMSAVSKNILTLDEVETAYINQYGDFGTDKNTSRQWFKNSYNYVNDDDFNYFWNYFMGYVLESRRQMALYLNGFWKGSMTMNYKDSGGRPVQLPCNVTWDFELNGKTGVSGRGQEVRTSAEGVVTTNFSWQVNDMGGIEMSFDPAGGTSDPVNMLVEYGNLDKLDGSVFIGTSVGVNIDETDDFNLVKGSYAKGTRTVGGKVFGGKNKKIGTRSVVRNITKSGGHR